MSSKKPPKKKARIQGKSKSGENVDHDIEPERDFQLSVEDLYSLKDIGKEHRYQGDVVLEINEEHDMSELEKFLFNIANGNSRLQFFDFKFENDEIFLNAKNVAENCDKFMNLFLTEVMDDARPKLKNSDSMVGK
jgi:hypothetical protein